VLVGVTTILWSAINPFLLKALHVSPEEISDPTFVVSHTGKFFLLLSPPVVSNLLVSAIAEGIAIKATADIYAGRQPDVATVACLKLEVRKALPLLMTSILVKLAAMVGLLLSFELRLSLSVVWFFVGPAIVVENFGTTGSLKRSYNLVSGKWCYVFCIVFIFLVKAVIPSLFYVPLFAPMQTVMYFNLRVEKEGMNADVLLREMGDHAESDPYLHVPLIDDATPTDQGTPKFFAV
jgi:hypothetical protein